MKKKLVNLFKNKIQSKRFAAGVTVFVLAAVVGGITVAQKNTEIPEIPSYTDPVMEASIEEEETPLASSPKVSTKTTKKTSSKKVKMKTAAKKTYTKSLPQTSSTSKKTSKTENATVVTQTTEVKAVKEKYTKKSKVKVVTTTTTTTVTTTTTENETAATATTSSPSTVTGTVDISQIAPKADSRVITAYRTLGFTVEIDPSVSYSGYFDGRNQKITLKKADDTIYHELGHFAAFIAGNADKTASFTAIYNQEKSLYTAYNKAYVTQNSSEYFAESVKEFTLNPTALKSARPKTYEAVKEALDKLTDTQVAKIKKVYSVIWK